MANEITAVPDSKLSAKQIQERDEAIRKVQEYRATHGGQDMPNSGYGFKSLYGVPILGDILEARDMASKPVDTGALDDARMRAASAYDQLMKERAGVVTNVPTVNAPVVSAPVIDDAAAQAIRARQEAALALQERLATGQEVSPAELAYQRQQGDIAAQQLGAAAGVRGNAGVFARREAARRIAEQQQKAALDAALIHANEMAAARAAYATSLGGVREADSAIAVERAREGLTAGTETAHLQQGAQIANQNATLQGQQITNQAKQGIGALGLQGLSQSTDAAAASTAATEARRKYALEREANLYQAGASALAPGAPTGAPASAPAAPAKKKPFNDPFDSDHYG